ncbi:MAG: hypothetical protein ACREQF_02235 [Candidatus Binataceae bacterium]
MNEQRGSVSLAAAIVLGAVVVAVFLALWSYYESALALTKKTAHETEQKYQQTHKELTTCESARAALRASLDELAKQLMRQSAALEEVKRERDDGVRKWKEAERRAEAERTAAGARIATLMSRVAPKEMVEQCAALDKLRQDYAAGQIR